MTLGALRNKGSINALRRAEKLVIGDGVRLAYAYERYAELLSLLSRANVRLGDVSAARATNALAHFALIRSTDPGQTWIQSSFYFPYPALARLLLTDFQIERLAGDRAKSVAFLSAALSVVRDLALAAENEVGRFSIAQMEREILRTAAQYLCDTGRALDAMVAVNQLRDVSATRMAMRSIEQSNGSPPRPVTADVVRATAKRLAQEETALVQFVVTEESVFALVAYGALTIVKLPVASTELTEQTGALVESLANIDAEQRAPEARALLTVLYGELIAPLEAELAGARSLVIVPDDSLYRLPFAALIDPSGRHLVQRYSIGYASSVQAMSTGRRLPLRLQRALVAHSPVMTTFPALPAGPAEADAVRHGLPTADVKELRGNQLDRRSLVRAIGAVDVIHIASHAFVDSTAPERSFVLLNESTKAVGLLRVGDLLSGKVSMSGKPIVVLAACSSGSGQVFQEGQLGFGYGLTVAGASAAVMTFWEIEDHASLHFSRLFYESLGRKVDPVLAVSYAQRESIGKVPMGDWAAFFVQRAY